MSATNTTQACAAPPTAGIASRALGARLADFLELTKPRIALLVLVTVTVGYLLGSAGNWELPKLLHTLAAVALVAAGSSALNQVLERKTDARMSRTAARPLPSGRLMAGEALLFGISAGALGFVYLALAVNALTAVLALATLALYVGVYTPLKLRTSLCTAIGALPGALPAVLGWTAAAGRLDFGACVFFGILYLWQFPHFLAIGWLYREQYTEAGLKMLPASRPRHVIGFLSVGYALALLPVSLLPSRVELAGGGYFVAALVLGVGYLACAVRFAVDECPQTARGLLWSSLVYLPLLLLALTWDHFRLLQ
jgi:protoheme IX farnesyltransferase